jgi:hypothetical protein
MECGGTTPLSPAWHDTPAPCRTSPTTIRPRDLRNRRRMGCQVHPSTQQQGRVRQAVLLFRRGISPMFNFASPVIRPHCVCCPLAVASRRWRRRRHRAARSAGALAVLRPSQQVRRVQDSRDQLEVTCLENSFLKHPPASLRAAEAASGAWPAATAQSRAHRALFSSLIKVRCKTPEQPSR